ncbi:hypothetical protein M426DRAFT_8938 [Hypoxylon sp. CI-4A]|nr:hypothetical protein M426DRAFT_8938 [Hypoxylon sp. CI-4A]
MAEVLGIVSSLIAIGQVLAGTPKIIGALRSLADMKSEMSALINELKFLQSAKEYIDVILNNIGGQYQSELISTSEPAFCRSVRAQLEDVMGQLSKLAADCSRGVDKKGRPRPSRVKWLWNKSKVKRLCADARQARQDLHLILSGHMAFMQGAQLRAMTARNVAITSPTDNTQDPLREPAPVAEPPPRLTDSSYPDALDQVDQAEVPDNSLILASPTNTDNIAAEQNISGTVSVALPAYIRSLGLGLDLPPSFHECSCTCHLERPRVRRTRQWKYFNITIEKATSSSNCDLQCCAETKATNALRLKFKIRVLNYSTELNTDFENLDRSRRGGAFLRLRASREIPLDDEIWDLIRAGNVRKVKMRFLTQAAYSTDVGEDGTTYIYAALQARQFSVVQYLLEATEINERTIKLAQEIISSIYDTSKWERWKLDILKHLIQAARDTDFREHPDYGGIHAAAKGLRDVEQHIAEGSQSIDEPDENGNSALHWACHGGNIPVLKLLLDAGANVNVQDYGGQTPLMKAAHRGNAECVEALLSVMRCNVNMVDSQGRSALHYAAASPYLGGSKVITLLLSRGASPLLSNHGGETPVHEVASFYTSSLPSEELCSRLEALVRAGSKLDSVDKWNYTPALQAVAEDNAAALEALLCLNAPVAGVDCDKQNVFHWSALCGSLETLEQLRGTKTQGVDIEAPNYQQETPFQLFEWRYGLTEGMLDIDMWFKRPTTQEYTAFRALLWEAQNQNLDADITNCQSALKALRKGDDASAILYLDALVDRYAAWVKEEEFEVYRHIRGQIEDRSITLARRALTDAIKVSTERKSVCPVPDLG